MCIWIFTWPSIWTLNSLLSNSVCSHYCFIFSFFTSYLTRVSAISNQNIRKSNVFFSLPSLDKNAMLVIEKSLQMACIWKINNLISKFRHQKIDNHVSLCSRHTEVASGPKQEFEVKVTNITSEIITNKNKYKMEVISHPQK